MDKILKRPNSLTDVPTHYCPGCTHGVVHRITAEVIDELGIQGNLIGVAPVGCAVFINKYIDCDWIQAPHGRAPALAFGIKKANEENFVFTYQGDGDIAAIGTAEIVHAANRGDNITVIFVNNAIYGMTGGQMAPTSLANQLTQTTPTGRDVKFHGYPLRMCEMLATLEGAAFVERVSVHDFKNIQNTKRAIKKAFKVQEARRGCSIVEVLSTCPTNWGMSPTDSLKWLKENMIPYYPIKNFKDVEGV